MNMGNKSRIRKAKDIGKPWAQVRGTGGSPKGWGGLMSSSLRFATSVKDASGTSRPFLHRPSRDRYLRSMMRTKTKHAVGAMTRGLR
jgi:hypothetical protein